MSRSQRFLPLPSLALLAVLLGAGPSLQAAEPVSLFALSAEKSMPVELLEDAAEAGRIDVDLALLERAPESVRIPLFGGQEIVATKSRFDRRGDGDVTWMGSLDGGETLGVSLTLKSGHLSGVAYTPDGIFEIIPFADQQHTLKRLDPRASHECGSDLIDPDHVIPAGPFVRNGALPTAGGAAPLPGTKMTAEITTMVVYSDEAATRAGSTGAMQSQAQAAIDSTNMAFANSGVDAVLQLVHVDRANFSDTNTRFDDLNWLSSDPRIASLRVTHRADLVAMMLGSNRFFSGQGFVMRNPSVNFAPAAFQVTVLRSAVVGNTFAHEVGHNLGLEHDPINGPSPNRASFPWSFGHVKDLEFRTVMAYRTECFTRCTPIPFFSDPDLNWQGTPIGIPDQRDNSRTLEVTTPIAARFFEALGGGGGGGGGGGNRGPTPPRDLAINLDGFDADLTWTDASNNESGFRLYRQIDGGSLDLVAELAADTTSYSDEDLDPSTTYTYQVGAYNGRGERRGGSVAITTPAATPVTVSLNAVGGSWVAGDRVEFTALTTGPVERLEWSYGPDEYGFSTSPCGSGSYCSGHLYQAPGTYTVDILAIGDAGQTATASTQVTVGAGGGVIVADETLVQSSIFGPRGNTGTFQSTCWLHNAGTDPVLVELVYLPRGAGNPNPETRRITLDPGTTMTSDNFLGDIFQRTDTQGSLSFRYMVTNTNGSGFPAPDLRSHCRSYVELDGSLGSFGQLVPEQTPDQWNADDKVVTGIFSDADWGATILGVNVDDAPGAVNVDLFDADGNQVGSRAALGLGPRTMRQRPLRSLFPEVENSTGPFTARFSSTGIRFLASSTLLESDSEDQIFVPARSVDFGANPLFLPRVTRSQSQFGAFLISQMVAQNDSASPTTLDIEFWQRGQDNSTPAATAQVTIPARGTLVYDDVITELFGLDIGVGALHVSWTNSEGVAPRIQTYAINDSPTGDPAGGPRFGMLVNSLPLDVGSTGTARVFGAEQTSRFRADYGVINLAENFATVRVTLEDENGNALATTDLSLRPKQVLERNIEGIFRNVRVGEGQNWTVRAEVLTGGPILTYLASVNVSGDIFFVPGR